MTGGGKEGEHPLRCRTCDHWKGHYDVPFCKFWDDKIPITKYGVDLIAHVGCASHSSSQQDGKAEQRIADAIGILEMQIGCSMMLDDDGDSELAYTQLRDECKKAISLLKEGGK